MQPQSFSTLWTALGNISTVDGLIHLAVGLVVACVFAAAFIFFFLRKEVRLFMNLRRPIMVITDGSRDVTAEVSLLRKSKLFKVEQPTSDSRSADEISSHSLVIIGYAPGMAGFTEIVGAARTAKIPLIVYTKELLAAEDKTLLAGYPWYSVCNFPLKLVSDTFTILSTFPKMK